MNVLPVLLIASLALGSAFLIAFIWAVRSGQFDDTTTPAMRLFGEETSTRKNPTENLDKEKKRHHEC